MRRMWLAGMLLLLAAPLQAQVQINGYVQNYERFRLQQNGRVTWNESRLGLKFEGNPSDNLHYYSELRIRSFGFPNPQTVADLQRRDRSRVAPWAVEVREAYIDLYGFLLDNLDLRIGKQRIAWGTADNLNPTDNLNPDDLEDIFDFGQHLGSQAIRATYYFGDWTLTGVFIPVFTPAVLPFGDWAAAFSEPTALPSGMTLVQFTDRLRLPEPRLGESASYGVKIAGSLLNFDVSLSYYAGRDDLPLMSRLAIVPVDTPGQVRADAELVFPRMRVLGFDLAGSIGSVGVWAEAGVFLPEDVRLQQTLPDPQAGLITRETVALSDEPYVKWVVGADYTFKSGWYVNAQFLHGFLHERGRDQLQDYIALRLEKSFMHDALKLALVNLVLAIQDWRNLSENYGLAGGPSLDYKPTDALTVSLGAFLVEGRGEGLFSRVKQLDEVFFKVVYDF
ncbi:MAG: hypothetical protein Q9P90_06525 [candidate division KSB1 bacterium]|nr:hypothetical protein [candidate division KSB1 bacterium]